VGVLIASLTDMAVLIASLTAMAVLIASLTAMADGLWLMAMVDGQSATSQVAIVHSH
jgi:hypothetical protein